MKKQLIFNFKKETKEIRLKKQEKHREETFPDFDFILLPYAFLLGYRNRTINIRINKEKFLIALFSKSYQIRPLYSEIVRFFHTESAFYKKDPLKKHMTGNSLSADEFQQIILCGTLEIFKRHGSIQEFKRKFRRQIPKSDPHILFSLLSRYINNGYADEYWYEETGKEIVQLFSKFDPELIASLLSITSIRATVSSNATKFFKALDQFFAGKEHVVEVGNKSNRKKMQSSFIGFLDASLYHLNHLKNGHSLIDPQHRLKNGRKIKNFADAMLSNIEAIVADVWITRAFGCDRKRIFRSRTTSQSPSKAIYDAVEWYLQTLGGLVGKTPRGVCAMIWSGIRQENVKGSTRYTEMLRKRLDHGLFHEMFGELIVNKAGKIEFETRLS